MASVTRPSPGVLEKSRDIQRTSESQLLPGTRPADPRRALTTQRGLCVQCKPGTHVAVRLTSTYLQSVLGLGWAAPPKCPGDPWSWSFMVIFRITRRCWSSEVMILKSEIESSDQAHQHLSFPKGHIHPCSIPDVHTWPERAWWHS